jgi:hypothetical protein
LTAEGSYESLVFPKFDTPQFPTCLRAWSSFSARFKTIAIELQWTPQTQAYKLCEKLPEILRSKLSHISLDIHNNAQLQVFLDQIDSVCRTFDRFTLPQIQANKRSNDQRKDTRRNQRSNELRQVDYQPRPHPFSRSTAKPADKPQPMKPGESCYICNSPLHKAPNCPDRTPKPRYPPAEGKTYRDNPDTRPPTSSNPKPPNGPAHFRAIEADSEPDLDYFPEFTSDSEPEFFDGSESLPSGESPPQM